MRVALFDSGVGGLTVLAPFVKEANKHHFQFELNYYGDLANLPYGTKSPDQVKKLTLTSMHQLSQLLDLPKCNQPTLILIACNTASALALNEVQQFFSPYKQTKVVGVIEAGCRSAQEIAQTQKSRVVVLGTQATIQTHAHRNTLNALGFAGDIVEKACPLFVPLVEESLFEGPLTDLVLSLYLDSFLQPNDVVILGCTHYPLLKIAMKKKYPQVFIVDPGEALSQTLIKEYKNTNPVSNVDWSLRAYFTDNTVDNQKLNNLLGRFQITLPNVDVLQAQHFNH